MLSFMIKCLAWFRGGRSSQPQSAAAVMVMPTAAQPEQPGPAVAGFVLRLPLRPTNFHLPARLASVAHLNTRAGRIPTSRGGRTPAIKAMPKLQDQQRKRSAPPIARPVAASRAVTTARIIALPLNTKSRCIPLDIRIAKAA